MKVIVNGAPTDISAETLAAALVELKYANMTVATALNSDFVPEARRPATPLKDGDRIEIIGPMSGG